MKVLVVYCCLFSLALGIDPAVLEQIKNTLNQLSTQCQAQTGIGDDEMAAVRAHNLPTTRNGKCFLACLNKQLGFQDQSGKIDVESSRAAIEKVKPLDEELYVKMKQVLEACAASLKHGVDECETAWNIAVCVNEQNEKFGVKDPLGY